MQKQQKNQPNIKIWVPECENIDTSKYARKIITYSVGIMVEAFTYDRHTEDSCEELSKELSKWLVKVCDPEHQCKMCKSGKGN